MKKNTGFIKKCKAQLSAEYQQQLLKDIKTLTLEKYISEVVVAVVEGLQKCKVAADVWAAVEVSFNLFEINGPLCILKYKVI
jgi:regulator of nonsense transcripts 2